MLSCQRCGETHSGPEAFLLTCRGCRKNWHHRCLMPPMGDQHLIQLIRATNARDTANDIGSWMCRRCKKRGSEAPSAMSSREQTASSESRESSKGYLTSSHSSAVSLRDTASTARTSVASTTDVRVKQELSTTVDARLVNDRERNKTSDLQDSTEAAPVKRTLSAKRTKLSTANQLHAQPQSGATQPRDADVQMAGTPPAKLTLQGKKRTPQRLSPSAHSHPVKAARKLGSTLSTTSSEDDVEMQVDPPTLFESPSRATSRASQAYSSIRPESVAEAPLVRATSANNEQGREVRTAVGAASQLPINQVAADEVDDDPEDLYGPPVERRIIRILPSLAEELREQQRRVAAEKEKRRVPLAPDWILARHVNDPLWKEIPATEGRKRRKPTATKLGDNGLNVNELMGCFTVENWVREHKT